VVFDIVDVFPVGAIVLLPVLIVLPHTGP
jgi:hypothetical protein